MKVAIIGNGLAGSILGYQLQKEGIDISIYGNTNNNASKVAAGIINPIMINQMKFCYAGLDAFDLVPSFYEEFNSLINTEVFQKRSLNFVSSTSLEYQYSNPKQLEVLDFVSKGENEFSYTIDPVYWLDTELFLQFLDKKLNVIQETFQYEKLENINGKWRYDLEIFDIIVFAEGYHIKNNPYLPNELIPGKKGHVLLGNCSFPFKNNDIIKNGVFCFEAPHTHVLGTTYDWNDLSDIPKEKVVMELLHSTNKNLDSTFLIDEINTGIRASSRDKRPIVGEIPNVNNAYILNGLGSRGTLYAPYLSSILIKKIVDNVAVAEDISPLRFKKIFHQNSQTCSYK